MQFQLLIEPDGRSFLAEQCILIVPPGSSNPEMIAE